MLLTRDGENEAKAKAMSVVQLACLLGLLGGTANPEAVVRGSAQSTHHYIIKSFIKKKTARAITETGSGASHLYNPIPSATQVPLETLRPIHRRVSVTISTFVSSLLQTWTFRRRLRGRGFRCRRFGRGRFGCGRLSIGALWLSHARVLAIPQRMMTLE